MRQPLLGGGLSQADHEFVGAEGLSIEESAALQSEVLIKLQMLSGFGERRDINTQGCQQTRRDGAVGARAVDFQGAAVQ